MHGQFSENEQNISHSSNNSKCMYIAVVCTLIHKIAFKMAEVHRLLQTISKRLKFTLSRVAFNARATPSRKWLISFS